ATAGVALAAVYMIRFYQRSMHNRVAPGVESRDVARWELGLLAPLVAVILVLGVYPNFMLKRSEAATVAQLHPEISVIGSTPHKGGPAGGKPIVRRWIVTGQQDI